MILVATKTTLSIAVVTVAAAGSLSACEAKGNTARSLTKLIAAVVNVT